MTPTILLNASRTQATVAVPTAEAPAYHVRIAEMTNGRVLLSDDLALIDAIAASVARKIDEIRLQHERTRLEQRDREIQQLATEAELRALRAQLNPHFLFNALNTLGHLMHVAPDRASATLYRLTSLLRAVLRKTDGQFVSLSEELDIVESYLAIERERFEERLTVTFDIPAELRCARVPPLMVQPLVENAVKHGIAPCRDGGRITISARRDVGDGDQTGHLRVVVMDTGRGSPFTADVEGAGIGLANIEGRLEHYFGAGAMLNFVPTRGGGTTVELCLPWIGPRRRDDPRRDRLAHRWATHDVGGTAMRVSWNLATTHSPNTTTRWTSASSMTGMAILRFVPLAAHHPPTGNRMTQLRVIVADDERPARAFLTKMLSEFEDVTIVGEATNGVEAVELIEQTAPDLALLDLQMPEVDGLGVIRLLRRDRLPLIAFVTAYDEYAVRAFEANAVDYLLKPVDPSRLRQTINRAIERLERAELRPGDAERIRTAANEYVSSQPAALLRRIPVRKRDDIFLVPVDQVVSIVADAELLHVTTRSGERHTITYRLKDLEARLDPGQFVRISRGTLLNIAMIQKITPMPGGTYVAVLHSGAEHQVSRIRGRVLRDQLLRL